MLSVVPGIGRMLMLAATLGHPLAPLVVSHKRKGEDDEDENGEGELHKSREQGIGSRE
jgi:hypothetical protein